MKKVWLTVFTALMAMVLVACGGQNPSPESSTSNKEESSESSKEVKEGTITITDANGEVEVTKNPSKVVVFDLAVVDTLRAIGKVDVVVGAPLKTVPSYLSDLPETIQSVGSMKEPDFEAIAALQPQLIVASGRTRDYIDKFKEIAPTIYLPIDNKDYWTSVSKNIKTIASLFEQKEIDQANNQLAALDKEISTIKKANEASTDKALALMLNEGNMSIFGANSRFAFLFQTLGFKASDAEIKDSSHGQEISFEGLKEINPDILFVLNRTLAIGGDASSDDSLLENDLVKETNAVKNKKVVNLTSDLWYLSPGGLQGSQLMIENVKTIMP